MKKRIVSLILLVFILMQTVAFATDTRVYSEDDTKQLVTKLNALGVFEKFDDEMFFGDNYPIKRYEAAVVISKLLGLEEFTSGTSHEVIFFDVPQYFEYIGAVNFTSSLGIMTGNESGLFLPENEMEIGHVLKAMVVALGYQWKAMGYGGYPNGYVRMANELKLTDGLSKGMTDKATRLDFLKIVANSLDTPICVTTATGKQNINLEISENVTLLTEYHDIYFDKGIVKNDKIMSVITEVEANDEKVNIGSLELFVNGVTDIYSYLGHEVEFYYKKDVSSDQIYLISVVPTKKNMVERILKKDFVSFDGERISYKSDNGSYKKIKIGSSVSVVYNGDVITSGIKEKIENYQGAIKLIDNNGDRSADIVIINNYTYDKVQSIDIEAKKVYAENNVFNFEDYDAVSLVLAATGEEIELSGVVPGDIIGFAKSENGEKFTARIIRGGAAVTVSYIGEDDFGIDGDIEYGTELLNEEHKLLIKPGRKFSLYTDDGYYAVWIDVASESLPVGYLISLVETTRLGKTLFGGVKLLDTNGEIKILESANAEKVIFNGTKIKSSELRQRLSDVKSKYNLGGDGEVTQVISYKTDDNGCISEIYTLTDDAEGKLFYEYGYKNYGRARFRDDGWGTGRYGVDRTSGLNYTFAITNGHPIFEVPESEQEDAPDNYYRKTLYNKSAHSYGGWAVDTYVEGENGVIPKAMVIFKQQVDTNIDLSINGNIFFVEKSFYSRDPDENTRCTLKGIYNSEKVTYYFDDSIGDTVKELKANADNEEEKAGLSPGDAVNIALNAAGEIQAVEKVFDYETQTIKKAYEDADLSSTCAIRLINVYNVPKDGIMLEAYAEDLTEGIPGEEKKMLINLHARTRAGGGYIFYDPKNEIYETGAVGDIIDYRKDPVNHTAILIKYNNNYEAGSIFYNR